MSFKIKQFNLFELSMEKYNLENVRFKSEACNWKHMHIAMEKQDDLF